MRFLIVVMFAVMAAGLPQQGAAEPTPAESIKLIAEISPIQQANAEMDQLLARLAEGSSAFDVAFLGQITMEQAIATADRSLEGARAEVDSFADRLRDASLTPTSDEAFNTTVQSVLTFIKEKPAFLLGIVEDLERQIAAARSGDMATVEQISIKMGATAVVLIDNENMTMRLQLAILKSEHPQRGLTKAWIATNVGMRAVAVMGSATTDDDLMKGIAALPAALRSAAGQMREAISQSERATEQLRQRTTNKSAIGRLLGLRKGSSQNVMNRLLDEYAEALLLERQIASHLDNMAALFDKLAAGDFSEPTLREVTASDEKTARLVLERQREMGERMQVIGELK